AVTGRGRRRAARREETVGERVSHGGKGRQEPALEIDTIESGNRHLVISRVERVLFRVDRKAHDVAAPNKSDDFRRCARLTVDGVEGLARRAVHGPATVEREVYKKFWSASRTN